MSWPETDDDLIEQGRRVVRADPRFSCTSIVIADATIVGEPVRAYFVCAGGAERHTVHYALNGDEWWRDSISGEWKHQGDELTDINWKGASTE